MAERKTYMLIEKDGKRQLVKSLNGHEGWTVVKDRVPDPPSSHHHLTAEGTWAEDAEAKERGEIRRLIRAGRLREALALLQEEKNDGI